MDSYIHPDDLKKVFDECGDMISVKPKKSIDMQKAKAVEALLNYRWNEIVSTILRVMRTLTNIKK